MRDRFIGRFITAFVLLCIVHTNAYGLYIDSFMAFGYIYLDEDLVVTDSGGFNSTGIDIGKSIAILNSGVINSDFYITAPLRVYVKNSGIINGEFHVSSDARLIQVIESVDDITGINVDSSFRVLVHDASNISLTDVFSVATNAEDRKSVV